jgi:hypothetical protein
VAAEELEVSEQLTKASFSVRDLRQRISERLNAPAGSPETVAAGASNG